MKIAVVVPTIRAECYERFHSAWESLFKKHAVSLVAVRDGPHPSLFYHKEAYGVADVMGESKDCDLIFNQNDGVRNLGFAFCARFLPQADVIITLDDDVLPSGDPIEEHLKALSSRVPVSWFSTAHPYMRGFPYGIRQEAEVVLSHGVWDGVKDYDAPTQLVLGNQDALFYRGVIPKGVYYPMCIMNVAIKRKLLPFFYQAPMGPRVGLDRFADIWCGVCSKRAIDDNGWAVVSGYSTVLHERASNVFTNLQKEAKGLQFNETFWQSDPRDPYFAMYLEKRNQWRLWIEKHIQIRG